MLATKTIDGYTPIMDAKHVKQFLGISSAFAYEVLNSANCPTIRIGKRMVVAKESFLQFIKESVGKQTKSGADAPEEWRKAEKTPPAAKKSATNTQLNNWEKGLTMYNAGATDREIAEALDCKTELDGKSRDMNFGMVGLKQSTRLSYSTAKTKEIIKKLKQYNMTYCIHTDEKIKKEGMKQYSNKELARAGVKRMRSFPLSRVCHRALSISVRHKRLSHNHGRRELYVHAPRL